MLGVDAEDDGLLEAVAALLEEVGDLLRDELRPLVDDERAVEVLLVVDPVLDVDCPLDPSCRARAGSPRCHGRCGPSRPCTARGTRRGCPASASSCRSACRSSGCSRRTSVSFGVAVMPICVALEKYVEDVAPGRVLGRAAAVALVHDDQVEEVRRQLLEELLALLRPGDAPGRARGRPRTTCRSAASCRSRSAARRACRRPARSPWMQVLSFAIAEPNGRKSLTIVWSTSTLRSARNRIRFFRPAFQSRQMIWKAV